MRLIKFQAKEVHDYLTINLNFNDDLSIITGSNGSGKTTALLLIQGILCPNFRDLFSIPFQSMELTFNDKNEEHTILVTSDSILITIRVDNSINMLEMDKRKYIEYELINYKESSQINEMIIKSIGTHPVLEFIKALPSPIFIGLERRTDDSQIELKDFNTDRRGFIHKVDFEYNTFKRKIRGSLGVSLVETELLIQSIYKKLRVLEDRYSNELQDEIVLSFFDYIPSDVFPDIKGSYQEKRNLLSRRKEIEQALTKIGSGTKQRLTQKMNDFFVKMEALIDSLDDSQKGISLELLTNQSQMDKLSKLVGIIDENKSKVQKGFKPINEFLTIINSFFNDSQKSIYVDEVGHLFVKRPNGKDVTIDALSSGERQILILFGNVMFNKSSSESSENVLLIDEPELSLHIRWQEIFIEKLLTASHNTQFILATHSPDIVGDHKNKGIKINKTN